MASYTVNIFADSNMDLFVDPERTKPLSAPLFQAAWDPTTFYLDEALTVRVSIVPAKTEAAKENIVGDCLEPQPSTSSSYSPNMFFTKEQTLFLIDLMRDYTDLNGEGPPKTFQELNHRMRDGKNRKRQMWTEMASKLSTHFKQHFSHEKVSRKWHTLEEAYKRVKDNNRTTGQGRVKFQFYAEMDDLLGKRHDVDFPVVGTAGGVEVRNAEVLGGQTEALCTPPPSTPTGRLPPTQPPTQPPTKRRRQENGFAAVLDFLKDSETASQRRHEDTMQLLRSSQEEFVSLMKLLIDRQRVDHP
ncbi:uncharacterized protein [Paramormyrops kingsleyae]|uniref:uncharacterized protein n=1 Tax=Paramormyrops kingsleyae TaxID=1676925 RepID=UPI003B978584